MLAEVVLTCIVIGVVVWYVLRYNRQEATEVSQLEESQRRDDRQHGRKPTGPDLSLPGSAIVQELLNYGYARYAAPPNVAYWKGAVTQYYDQHHRLCPVPAPDSQQPITYRYYQFTVGQYTHPQGLQHVYEALAPAFAARKLQFSYNEAAYGNDLPTSATPAALHKHAMHAVNEALAQQGSSERVYHVAEAANQYGMLLLTTPLYLYLKTITPEGWLVPVN